MPVFKNFTTFRIARDLQAFFNLEIGLVRSPVADPETFGISSPPVLVPDSLERNRRRLLDLLDAPEVTFVRSHGNLGDDLIYAGTRKLLAGVSYTEVEAKKLGGIRGHTALLSGGGAWSKPFHKHLPHLLPELEKRFKRVIVMPSSFDVSVDSVREALERTKALVFARELESYRQIRDLCNSDIAHDCAFFFDFGPYRRRGEGRLIAYRTDRESSRDRELLPRHNNDISKTCQSLDEWLWTISGHDTVETDRAHVMIAAAMLGKRVEFQASTYHKVPAIAEFSLNGFPVHRSTADRQPV
jgi:exopolysaccharide biosynthesis predicted pyruvyltransferase EpsI